MMKAYYWYKPNYFYRKRDNIADLESDFRRFDRR